MVISSLDDQNDGLIINFDLQFDLQQLEEEGANTDPKKFYLNAWQITQSLILTICANFLFLRIYFIFKLLVGLAICTIYSLFIIDDPMDIYKVMNQSLTMN